MLSPAFCGRIVDELSRCVCVHVCVCECELRAMCSGSRVWWSLRRAFPSATGRDVERKKEKSQATVRG